MMIGKPFWRDQFIRSLRLYAVATDRLMETGMTGDYDPDVWELMLLGSVAIRERLSAQLVILGGMAGEW